MLTRAACLVIVVIGAGPAVARDRMLPIPADRSTDAPPLPTLRPFPR